MGIVLVASKKGSALLTLEILILSLFWIQNIERDNASFVMVYIFVESLIIAFDNFKVTAEFLWVKRIE